MPTTTPFASLECELIDRRCSKTKTEARLALFTYIEGWYNPRRRHSALGHLSPAKFETKHVPRPHRETDLPNRRRLRGMRYAAGGQVFTGVHQTGLKPSRNPSAE